MKNIGDTKMVHKKGVITTGLNISLALLFVTSSFSVPYVSETTRLVHLPVTVSDTNCFGFLIPLPSSEKIDEDPEVQNSTMNLINDLLRLQVPVYWSKDTFLVSTKQMNSEDSPEIRSFEPGTFIVPFSEITRDNAKIISVMNDYNLTHELHKHIQPTMVYKLTEQLFLDEALQLVEPKIAYYYDEGVYSNSLNWYVSTLYQSGFLSNEYLSNEDVITSLDPSTFNVFIWPGGEIVEDINSNVSVVTRILKQNKIKEFVAEGGGYIGSCYGAFAASSGTRFYPIPLLPYYFSHMPSVGFLSLQDCFTSLGISCSINVTIEDSSHPVLFGVNGTVHDSQLRGGAVYTWLGENTESLGVIKEVNSTIWTHWFRDLFSSNSSYAQKLIDLWVKFTTGKTVWTTSEYKNGKVVTFGDHPEIGQMHLQRIIHNSVFYVSSQSVQDVSISLSLADSEVNQIAEKSHNLPIINSTSGLFTDVYEQLDSTISEYLRFNDVSSEIFNVTWSLLENNSMDMSIAIGLFVSGMWEFSGTIDRSMRYLDNENGEDSLRKYLVKIEDIYDQSMVHNISLDESIDVYKEDVQNRFIELKTLNEEIASDLERMYMILKEYDGSSVQNEILLELADQLWDHSKNIEKNCPGLFFDSLKFLRDIWYSYESA